MLIFSSPGNYIPKLKDYLGPEEVLDILEQITEIPADRPSQFRFNNILLNITPNLFRIPDTKCSKE